MGPDARWQAMSLREQIERHRDRFLAEADRDLIVEMRRAEARLVAAGTVGPYATSSRVGAERDRKAGSDATDDDGRGAPR